MEILKIGKQAGKVQAFVINRNSIKELEEKAPKISKAICYDDEANQYLFDNEEAGHFGVTCRENDVIRYEEHSDMVKCPAGWNLWRRGTLEEVSDTLTKLSDIEFFEKAVSREAIFFTSIQDAKSFISERCSTDYMANNVILNDNSISIKTEWGTYSGNVGKCFIVCYGKDDCNILTLGTESIDAYWLLDSDGNFVKKLSNY